MVETQCHFPNRAVSKIAKYTTLLNTEFCLVAVNT